MILKKIKVQNFLSYKSFELDLNKGLCLINGWNYDESTSNGSGKSGILDSISFSIYGESPRNVKIDEMINNLEKKECRLEIDFELNNNEYKIIRTRKPNDLILYENNKEIRGKDINETQKIIQNIIKLDYKTFITSSYISQNNTCDFIILSDSKKQELLTNVLDVSVFDRAHDKALEYIKCINSELQILNNNIGKNSDILSTYQQQYNITVNNRDNFEQKRKDQLTIITSQLTDKDNELNALNNKLKEEVVSKDIPKEPNYDKIFPLKDITNDPNKEKIIKNKLSEVNTKFIQCDYKISECNKILNKFNNLQGTCANCGQIISEEHISNEIERVQIELKQAVETKELNKSCIIEYESLLDDINVYKQDLIDLDKKRSQLKLKYMQDRRDVEIYNNKIQQGHDIINKEVNKVTNEINNLINKSELIQSQENLYINVCEDLNNKINDLKQLNDDLLINRQSNLSALQQCEVLKEAYKNIKYYLFDAIIDELNQLIDTYISLLFNSDMKITVSTEYENSKGEKKQKFVTNIIKGGYERSLDSFSGGEKQRINLATTFALADVLLNRGSNKLNIMFLDEVLSKGLDSEGAGKIVELLEFIKKDKNIFIIDHMEHVKNIIDNEIIVEKRHGESNIIT